MAFKLNVIIQLVTPLSVEVYALIKCLILELPGVFQPLEQLPQQPIIPPAREASLMFAQMVQIQAQMVQVMAQVIAMTLAMAPAMAMVPAMVMVPVMALATVLQPITVPTMALATVLQAITVPAMALVVMGPVMALAMVPTMVVLVV